MYCTFCGKYLEDVSCSCNIRKIATARGITYGVFCAECGQQHCWHLRPECNISEIKQKIDLLDKIITHWLNIRTEHAMRIEIIRRLYEPPEHDPLGR
jgi:transcription elongation factor Elf1